MPRADGRERLISESLGRARGLYQRARELQRELASLVEAGATFGGGTQTDVHLGRAQASAAAAMTCLEGAGKELAEAVESLHAERDAALRKEHRPPAS